eukprot:XP_011679242.1 PREDICTED: myosin-3-like [Strongylocentrotus purpuratus]
MSVTVKQKKNLPLLPSRLRKLGDTILPHMKEQLGARPADSFKVQKIRGESVQLLLKFLQESFDLAPTTTPAETVCKLRLKMSHTDNKIKRMTEHLKDHDVLLFDVQEELNLGSEVNAVRTARAFKKYIRTSKEQTAYLEKTIKGNEALLKTCKEIAGVSGHHAPAGLASYFSSTWSRQRHVISKLNNTIQELKENGHSLPKKDSKADLEESILDLARAMDVDTSNSPISTIVTEMKSTFTSMKNDVINLNDMVKVKKEEIKNVQDLERTKTDRIVELENELDDLKTRNNYLDLDRKQTQEERKSAAKLVNDLEHKISDLQIGNGRKTLEIEDLLQRYEEAGEVVSNLQSELDDTKQLNQFLNLQIKDLDRPNAKDNAAVDWEQQKKELESDLEKLQTSESKKDNQILELEKEIAILQKQKQELETNLETQKSKDTQTDLPKPESQDQKTTEFFRKTVYDFTMPKSHPVRDGAEDDHVLVENKVDDSLRQMKEQGLQLERLHQEKDDLISQHEADISRVTKKNVELAKLLQGLIDQRRESISLIQECGDQCECLDLLLRRNTERLRGEKEKHRVMTKNTTRQEKVAGIANPVGTQEHTDVDGKMAAMTREVEKLREKIAHLKTKMADISTELEQSQQDCQKVEENFAKASQQLKKFESGMEVVQKEKDNLSSQIKNMQKDKKELDNQLKAVNEEKDQLQSRADSMEEEKDDLSAQLSEAHKQYQELEEGFAAVYAEKKQLQTLTLSLEGEKDELSAQLSERLQQYQEPEQSFTAEDQGGELEWDDEIEPMQEERESFQEEIESFQPRYNSFTEERHEQKFKLRKTPKQRQFLGEIIPVIRKKTDPEKKQPNSQAEKHDDLSTRLEEATQKYQALEDKLSSLEEEGEKEQEVAAKLKEENGTLSTSLGSMRNLCKHLQEEMESLNQDNEKLRQEPTHVRAKTWTLRRNLTNIIRRGAIRNIRPLVYGHGLNSKGRPKANVTLDDLVSIFVEDRSLRTKLTSGPNTLTTHLCLLTKCGQIHDSASSIGLRPAIPSSHTPRY